MAMVNVVTRAAGLGGSIGSGWLALSKGRRPPSARAALIKWTRWTLSVAVAVHCYNDSTTNVVFHYYYYYLRT